MAMAAVLTIATPMAAIIKATALVAVAMPAPEPPVDDGRNCGAHVRILSILYDS
jgi:hypothetical protein